MYPAILSDVPRAPQLFGQMRSERLDRPQAGSADGGFISCKNRMHACANRGYRQLDGRTARCGAGPEERKSASAQAADTRAASTAGTTRTLPANCGGVPFARPLRAAVQNVDGCPVSRVTSPRWQGFAIDNHDPERRVEHGCVQRRN